MRIFIDGHFSEIGANGVGTFINNLYKIIIKKKRNYTFIIGAYDVDKIKEIFNYPNVIIAKYKNKGKYRYIIDIPKILKSYDIDIAHLQYVIPIFKNKKTIYINTMHDILFIEYPEYFPIFYRIIRTIIFYFSAKRSDLITTISKYSKNAIIEKFKIKKEKIYVTPLGADINCDVNDNLDYEIVEKHRKKKYILYVSRFEPRKKQDELLDIYIEMKLYNSGIDLIFVGFKSIRNRKFDIIYGCLNEEIKDHIYIYQKINDSTLNWLYENCFIFAYMSIAEGFGLPILEAAIKKKPVLLVDNTAMSDFKFLKKGFINIDEKNCLDKDELKNKIQLIINNKLYSENDYENIKKIILTKYNWENVANKYISLFETVHNSVSRCYNKE